VVLLSQLGPILGSAVDTWATVFVAVGTVGAVAYALFRDLFVVPAEGQGSILSLTRLETMRSSSGRRQDSSQRMSGCG
jgi:hypothetical protein